MNLVVLFPSVWKKECVRFGFGLHAASHYRTDSRDRLETSLSVSSNMSASFLLPSAPSSVISLSSDSVMSLMLTNLTSVSGIPSISSGTSAMKSSMPSLVHSRSFPFFYQQFVLKAMVSLGQKIMMGVGNYVGAKSGADFKF